MTTKFSLKTWPGMLSNISWIRKQWIMVCMTPYLFQQKVSSYWMPTSTLSLCMTRNSLIGLLQTHDLTVTQLECTAGWRWNSVRHACRHCCTQCSEGHHRSQLQKAQLLQRYRAMRHLNKSVLCFTRYEILKGLKQQTWHSKSFNGTGKGDPMFSHSGTIPACDGRIDRWTQWQHTPHSIVSYDKNHEFKQAVQ